MLLFLWIFLWYWSSVNILFQCCPFIISQLFIVSMCLSGIIWRPILYCFMPDKFQVKKWELIVFRFSHESLGHTWYSIRCLCGSPGDEQCQAEGRLHHECRLGESRINVWRLNFDQIMKGCLFYSGKYKSSHLHSYIFVFWPAIGLIHYFSLSVCRSSKLAENTRAWTFHRICVKWKSEDICVESAFHVACSSCETPRGPQTPTGPVAVVSGCCRPISRGQLAV